MDKLIVCERFHSNQTILLSPMNYRFISVSRLRQCGAAGNHSQECRGNLPLYGEGAVLDVLASAGESVCFCMIIHAVFVVAVKVSCFVRSPARLRPFNSYRLVLIASNPIPVLSF